MEKIVTSQSLHVQMCNVQPEEKISWNLLMIPRNVSENLSNFNVKYNEWMAQRNAVQHSVEYENAARCVCVYMWICVKWKHMLDLFICTWFT